MASAADVDVASPAGCCPVGTVSAQVARDFDMSGDPAALAREQEDGTRILDAVVETLECPSCVPGIERALLALDGVEQARVNATQKRIRLVWRPERIGLDVILERLGQMGHRIAAFDPARLGDRRMDEESRGLLMAMAVAGFGFANVMLISVAVWAGLVQDMGEGTRAFFHWLSALIALPAIAYAARPFFRSAFGALRAGTSNMDVPIAMAVTLAAGMSLFETTLNGPHVYYDAALGLLFFLLIGRFLDRSLRGRAFAAAENLLALRRSTAMVVGADGRLEERLADRIRPGERVAVAVGESLAVDGVVRRGRSELDEQLVSGETVPRPIGPGDVIHAGTVNLGAPIEVETLASGEGTLLSEIAAMMDQAGQRKARYVRFADRVARIYAPVVHAIALAAFVFWFGFADLDWRASLMIAVAVLIVTCPCALGLAVPAVQVGAVGRLLKRGVYVKSGDALERLADSEVMVFDKTGTLTLGRPELAGIDGNPDPGPLAAAVALARHSRHPLARALVEALDGAVPGDVGIEGIGEEPGQGMTATVDGRPLRLGRRDWVLDGAAQAVGALRGGEIPFPDWAGTELWVRLGSDLPIRVRFRDRPRADARAVIEGLRARGLEIRLLSGDRPEVVAELARDLGIEIWRGGQRPADKIAEIEALTAAGRQVAMVGDGLNDAPSLAAASVSLSPASAADISQTAADLVFRGDRLAPLLDALDVARRSDRLVRQNVALAFGYNVIAVPLAVVGLVTPLVAAIVMSASSIVVTANALRVQRGR